MTAKILPIIGTEGIYKLKAPFDIRLIPTVVYKCISVRSISDIVISGEDVLEEYYVNNGLVEADYTLDLANDEYILTLQAVSGDVLYVPSSYLLAYPDVGGVIYTPMMLGLVLGNIATDFDLTYLKSKIESVVLENIGYTTTCQEVVTGDQVIINNDDHDAIVTARNQLVGTIETDYSKYLQMKAERDSANLKIQQLEAYIRSL